MTQKTPKLSKRILQNPITQVIICRICWAYIKLVYMTSRVEWVIDDKAQAFMRGEENATLAFWHGRLLMMPYVRPNNKQMHVLISDHNDGRLISQVMTYFSIDTVKGSSSKDGKGKGAMAAVKGMLRILKNGENICITPDGPRGPFQEAAAGVVHVPSKTGVAVIPSAFSSSNAKRLGSWDKFMLPLPFGKLVYTIGEPCLIPPKLDAQAAEAARLEVQKCLTETTNLADKLAGRVITS